MNKTVAVIGLGLIGGSLCKAMKAYTDSTLYGSDIDAEVLAAALAYGAIDAPLTDELLPDCDLIISALYPADTVAFVAEHRHLLRSGTVIFDVCGVKELVCAGIHKVLEGSGVFFIGGHPMAGIEHSGFAASYKDLFQGASMVLTPSSETPKPVLNELSDFIRTLGFARIIDTTPEFHDRMIAYTSQLPHVIASSYVKSPNCSYHLGFTGGSFEDMSRVAKLNEAMWTELFFANKNNLVAEISTLTEHLNEMKEALVTQNADQLRELLRQGRIIKEGLSKE